VLPGRNTADTLQALSSAVETRHWRSTPTLARAVVVSSNSPCGCNPHPDHLFDEHSPFNPYMHYGRSKMEMELAIRERAARLETVIIRAPWFYGPNQPPRQTLFFQMIRDGKGPIVGSGTNLRSMAYVDNLCQGQWSNHVLSEMNKTIACSIGKAEAELGYRPAIELEEGMRRSLAWCRSQGLLFH
jgi:nucleoside-diphosphate-sugar epimerase